MEVGQAHLGVFGEVQHHGTRTAGPGDIKRPCNGPGYVFRAADLVVPFGDRTGKAGNVGLLESVRTQGGGRYLAGDDHQRRGIRKGIYDTGHHIRGTGTGRNNHHSRLTLDAGVALGGMDRPLLVAHQNVPDVLLKVAETVINRHNLAAGIAEDGIDTLFHERFPQGCSPTYLILFHIFLIAPSSAELTAAA